MLKRGGVSFGFVSVCCFVILVAVAYRALRFWVGPAQNGPLRYVFYEVKPHEGPQTIAKELQRLGLISSARFFYWYGRISGNNQKIKAADYRFNTRMTPEEVMGVLISGIPYGVPLTVPEGYTMYQIADILEHIRPGSKARFIKACTDRRLIASLGLGAPQPHNLEGYLFPDTYLLGRKTPEEEIVRSMVKKFKMVFTADLEARAKALGFSEYQIVTLASIVEKETGAKEERPLISSVFHNRLKKRMRLQSDPTVIYGIKNYNGNITRKDLETPTPYNTYTVKALPIGPIANPGKEAILAALYPVESKFLYFVSHNDGTHEFTTTYEDHVKAVAKFQLDRKAREGKSWRDLRKREQQQRSAGN